ncbi:VacB/RNase II family 3'-5' exoribonuclease [Sandaracinobacter sp. RS1-74]|uniref:ribonuclease R family protein n=1 Tax=Sandaracinobacteroides sayramensis TaxID=2913411 RepID=UPI001ED9E38A|nr:VacB/RNase II family 3'-5' exoribonuclease [Sandaracinobacteroides sayramensis]MCG2840598.1 VacB/RNase II family 3'-5' exoribonuclease [Sandaracinobacteroides sayramensis]
MSMPDREAILAFIRQTPSSVGKREIARAFGLKGEERDALKQLLREMEEEGLLAGGPGRSVHQAGGLPRVAVLTVVSADGARVLATPEKWEGEGTLPKVLIGTGTGRGRVAGRRERHEVGDRILTRIEGEAPRYLGTVIKKLSRGHALLMGVVAKDARAGLILKSIDKRERRTWPIHHASEVQPGELVRAELKGSGARTAAHVVSRLGDPFSGTSLSDIAIAAKGIPDEFPHGVEEEAERSGASPLGPREDWTPVPFITIDPADARDHDDAVWAEPEGDGWRLLVAIADVSWYVRPGSALDRSAFDRGNSVYFPVKVVPMLPEALSAGACSLKAGSDKAVLAATLHITATGELNRWSFHRARIRVAENLAYEAAQAVMDGRADSPLKAPVLEPLWGCWRALMKARDARAPLDLELPEKRVVLDAEGRVAGIAVRERLDAHRVIEEMMIAANVAAAKALEEKKAPVMYRCHEAPDREKLASLKEYLGTLGISFALGQVVTPATFNRVLERSRERTDLTEISEAVLRSQTQAYYAPRSTGHFGLALQSYAHFTSPIRRYSDVLVHRSLVSACRLGEGGLADGAEQRFPAIGEHISFTERRAMEAERETLDRYIARHLANHVGQVVRARISGVQAFGFFAAVEDIGGDGLVPVGALGDERFRFDEAGRYLEGAESGTRYSQGQKLDLRLEEADPVTGSLRFSIPGVEAVDRGPRFRRDGRGGPRQKRGGPPPGVRRGRKR